MGAVTQMTRPDRNSADARSVQVEVPQSYDGIGQALRSAYRGERNTTTAQPDPIASALRRLDTID